MKTVIPTIALVFLGLVIFLSLKLEKKDIVKSNDYLSILSQNSSSTKDQKEIEFWNQKLKIDSNCTACKLKLASVWSKKFREKASINDLLKADSILQTSLDQKLGITSIYQQLASISISRHNFQESWKYAQLALEEGEKKERSHFLLFDAALELGKYGEAEDILQKLKDKNSFNYLLRASKLEDKKGDLDQAIQLMEKGLEKTKGNDELFVWAISNLGDMYGHAGEIEKSYMAFLQALAINPNHSHSKMGLAWIAYSHDGNPSIAQEILIKTYSYKPDPQIKLMLAEMAEYEKNYELAELILQDYYDIISQAKYGFMYSKYLILIDAEKDSEKAVARSLIEINRRASPEIYDLLAWSYFKNDELKKALKIAEEHVLGKTFEPEVLYHLGLIYKEAGENSKSQELLEEALESEFELGPMMSLEIKKALKN
tara:strand:- start:134539 stop:135825 length:1287 start_codon:yes stop_codon:yes gene_type:complete